MLTAREVTEPGPMRSFPAVPSSVRPAREMVAAYARELGATLEQAEAIRLVVSEAATNAVLHAYADREAGRVHVAAEGEGRELVVIVADDGPGLRVRPDSPGMGLGLVVIAAMAEELTVRTPPAGGTEVRVRFAIGEAHTQPLHGV